MLKRKKYFHLLKLITTTILFLGALYFENAQKQRFFLLIAVFIIYLALGIFRYLLKGKLILYNLSFILDIALVYMLENNSRLLINYFFHSFYIIILLESVLFLNLKWGIAIGSVAVLVSMIKYFYLIYYKFNFSNVSQMSFFLIVNILILVTAGFAQHNKDEKEKKDLLYKELLNTHKQLKEYTDKVKRLSAVEERNRIARDIHDNLGHNMTALIMQLQMAEHFLNSDNQKSKELLDNSIKTAKKSLTVIREVVETLRETKTSIENIKIIEILVNEFSEKTGVKIELNVNGRSDINNVNEAIYHILQEALTNAVRHGKASLIKVNLEFFKDQIKFSISDNGVGAQEEIKEGYGLKGIRERVEAYNGSIEIEKEKGFHIKGIIYLGGNDDKDIASR